MKTYLERCPESAKINEINDLFTFRSKKKYRLRFGWNSQKWSFRTISWRRFWLEIDRGPLLLSPKFWKFWFLDENFSKIKIFRFFQLFDFSLISLRKWTKKSKTRFFSKINFFSVFEIFDFSFFSDNFLKEINEKSKNWKSENFYFENFWSRNRNFQIFGLRSRGPRLISSQNLRQDIVRKFLFWEFQENRSL